MDHNQQVALEMYKTESKRIFGLTGPSQANTRQTIMFLLTGSKLPKAKCGINALEREIRVVDPTAVRY